MKNNKIYIDGLQCSPMKRDYFEEAQNAGLDLIHLTVVFWENISDSMRLLGDWFRFLDRNSDLLQPATNLTGLKANIGTGAIEKEAMGKNKLSIMFGFQNCSSIENNIDMVEIYRRLNVGVMQFSYNNQSALCGGCYEKEDSGLSRFGKAVIKEMNRVGMIIDMSHSGDKSTLEAIEYSQRAIAITHAESLHFQKAIRNKEDATIKALAESGGILGLSFYPFHLKNKSECQITEMVDEIKRLIDLIGIDAIAIGSDIFQDRSNTELEYLRNGSWTKELDYGEGSAAQSGWPKPVKWLQRISDFANLESLFIENGLSETEAEKILGKYSVKNWLNF